MMHVQKPLITVVTVVLNSRDLIEQTIVSVLEQTYENIEFIVVDGESTDGTLDILRKYRSRINFLISEPDDGIYSGMNKGVAIASGQWINFMNAGDTFNSCDSILDIFEFPRGKEKIIYGDVLVNYGKFSIIKKAERLYNLWSGMKFSHQSAFIDTQYHKQNKYNEDYKITADFDFFYKARKNNILFKRENMVISNVVVGGVSEINRIETILDCRRVMQSMSQNQLILLCYKIILLDIKIRSYLKRLLPANLVDRIIKIKNFKI